MPFTSPVKSDGTIKLLSLVSMRTSTNYVELWLILYGVELSWLRNAQAAWPRLVGFHGRLVIRISICVGTPNNLVGVVILSDQCPLEPQIRGAHFEREPMLDLWPYDRRSTVVVELVSE